MEPKAPLFFASPADFRAWLDEHRDQAQELWVGFYKKNSGTPSITWPEAVDEALCCGWIDGVRKTVAQDSYAIRFTPRRPQSTWSSVNIKRAEELIALGRMHPDGLKAFEARASARSGIYAYENKNDLNLDDAGERQFRANQRAWDFFQSQTAWYRRSALWWVISAKKEETQQKRLTALIADSERGRTIPPLTRRPALERPSE